MLTPSCPRRRCAALEDSVYFRKPLTYAFISPLIYIAEDSLSWRWSSHRGGCRGPQATRRTWAWPLGPRVCPGALALAYFQLVDTSS